jgi:Fic family protein
VTPRGLGVAAHAALVHIHPFVDGNERVTRLVADLLFLAAQDEGSLMRYFWNFDRRTYIRLLGEYDHTREPDALIEFVPVVAFADNM